MGENRRVALATEQRTVVHVAADRDWRGKGRAIGACGAWWLAAWLGYYRTPFLAELLLAMGLGPRCCRDAGEHDVVSLPLPSSALPQRPAEGPAQPRPLPQRPVQPPSPRPTARAAWPDGPRGALLLHPVKAAACSCSAPTAVPVLLPPRPPPRPSCGSPAEPCLHSPGACPPSCRAGSRSRVTHKHTRACHTHASARPHRWSPDRMRTSSMTRFLVSSMSHEYWRTASAVPWWQAGWRGAQRKGGESRREGQGAAGRLRTAQRRHVMNPAAAVLLQAAPTRRRQSPSQAPLHGPSQEPQSPTPKAAHLEPLLVGGRLRGGQHLHKAVAAEAHARAHVVGPAQMPVERRAVELRGRLVGAVS
jgi:hypothetical protein